MVEFDASFALLIWRDVPASVDKSRERVAHLINELTQKQERILIPTPALTELLVRAGAAANQYLQEITKSARFKVGVYDIRAAVEVAAVIRDALDKKNKKSGLTATWAKVNFDRQIVAIGKVEQAHTIYTDDKDLGKFAAKLGLKVISLADLPIPPSKTPLFDNIPEQEETPIPPPPQDTEEGIANEQTAGEPETSDQLEADPAHPAPVQGSDSGRAQGEAASEAESKTEKPKPAKKGGLGEDGS